MCLSTRIVLFLICNAVSVASLLTPALARSGPVREAGIDAVSPLAAGRPARLDHLVSADLCRAAARSTELRLGLPPGILLAIGQVESARIDLATHRLEPWPWTVQALGKGLYFETKAEAIAWVEEAEARGITSIDAGCLQVNLLFHPHAFKTLDEAFDPQRNADYAGRFVRALYGEIGDWWRATGLYHSRTNTLSSPYQARVIRAWEGGSPGALSASGQPTLLDQLAAAWRSTLATSERPQSPTITDWGALGFKQTHRLSYGTRALAEHRRLTKVE
jgi:hypothetical protein